MKKFIFAFVALMCIAPMTMGCAAILGALPMIVAAVTDAMMVLDAIEDFVTKYFAANPDAEKQEAVAKSLAKTRSALNVALRTCSGTEDLSQGQVDAAFQDFRAAYVELSTLLGRYGLASQGDRLMATPGQPLVIPTPMAMTFKVK